MHYSGTLNDTVEDTNTNNTNTSAFRNISNKTEDNSYEKFYPSSNTNSITFNI